MGTRLYPMTKNPLTLETLVDVPRGTHDKLNKIYDEYDTKSHEIHNIYTRLQKALDSFNGHNAIGEALRESIKKEMDWCRTRIHDLQEAKFNEIEKDPDVSRLDHFILNGWGKFNLTLIPGPDEDKYCGETHDATLADKLLWSSTSFNGLNGVDLQELANTGLCWN